MKKTLTFVSLLLTPFLAFVLSSCLTNETDEKIKEAEEKIAFIEEKKKQEPTVSGQIGGHSYVDMGLNVKWATCNVGATKPTEYGTFFAWGETSPKEVYDMDSYKWYDSTMSSTVSSYNRFSKYVSDSFNPNKDNKTVLEKEDDAAASNWGGDWCMPSLSDVNDLMNNCYWADTDNYLNSGVAGILAISKINGNTIFFPFAGEYSYYMNQLDKQGSYGHYWTSTLGSVSNLNGVNVLSVGRHCSLVTIALERVAGRSVRAVVK